MRAALTLLLLSLATPATAQVSRTNAVDICMRGRAESPHQQIAACSSIIDARSVPRDVLSSAFNSRGIAHISLNDVNAAVMDFNAALRLDPGNVEALVNRASAYAMRGETARAVADYDLALRSEPHSADVLFNRGRTRSAQADWTGALADYDAALRIDPSHAPALNNRATLRMVHGDKSQAIADFSEVIRMRPQYSLAYYNRGTIYATIGDLPRALSDYDSALRINPGFAEAWASRCIARFRSGDRQVAMQECARAISLAAPTSTWPYTARAGLLLMLNDNAQAALDLTAALERNPRDSFALWLRGALRGRQNDTAGAMADGQAARTINTKIDDMVREAFGIPNR